MGVGVRIGAHLGIRQRGHTCKCPRCKYRRENCTKACYNYKCPKCRCAMVRGR